MCTIHIVFTSSFVVLLLSSIYTDSESKDDSWSAEPTNSPCLMTSSCSPSWRCRTAFWLVSQRPEWFQSLSRLRTAAPWCRIPGQSESMVTEGNFCSSSKYWLTDWLQEFNSYIHFSFIIADTVDCCKCFVSLLNLSTSTLQMANHTNMISLEFSVSTGTGRSTVVVHNVLCT